ncbi:MAG TPA: hypothetical protein VIV11_23910, partial [Kofleriaceae bacterium]
MASLRTAGLSVIAVYWLMLILGMVSCIAIRSDAEIAAIWTGTVAGTVLGHVLGLVNTRTWFAALTVLTTAAVVGPSAPGELSASTLWLAFIPAALCAFWSLGDRTTLVAFWFPAVIWMLSILDHAHANGLPNNTGIALLGVLAVLFVLFLRVRETRRVGLWSTVAAPSAALAVVHPPVTLKEAPGFRIARTGWALAASALAFVATAYVAPHLWQPEALPPEDKRVAMSGTGSGLPCCPIIDEVETPRARVKEYFAIGRGQDQEPVEPPTKYGCRRCDGYGESVATTYPTYRTSTIDDYAFEPTHHGYVPSYPDPGPSEGTYTKVTGGWLPPAEPGYQAHERIESATPGPVTAAGSPYEPALERPPVIPEPSSQHVEPAPITPTPVAEPSLPPAADWTPPPAAEPVSPPVEPPPPARADPEPAPTAAS